MSKRDFLEVSQSIMDKDAMQLRMIRSSRNPVEASQLLWDGTIRDYRTQSWVMEKLYHLKYDCGIVARPSMTIPFLTRYDMPGEPK